MNLLAATEIEGVERNLMLSEMAALVRRAPYTAMESETHLSDHSSFNNLLLRFMERFGDLSCVTKQCSQGPDAITDLVIELASVPENRELIRAERPIRSQTVFPGPV